MNENILKTPNSTKNNKKNNKEDTNDKELTLSPCLDIGRLKEFNTKSVDMILSSQTDSALEILKKLEVFLEANATEAKYEIDYKIIVVVLNNMAVCYQKSKNYGKCEEYLDAVVFNFDKMIELKHNIIFSEDYLFNSISDKNINYSLLGDFILESRFSAKFHLQMCAVLSQSGKHYLALKHAKLSMLMCEDNIIKTYYLHKNIQQKLENNIKLEFEETLDKAEFENKIRKSFKIVEVLFNRILSYRFPQSSSISKGNSSNNIVYSSYKSFTEDEIYLGNEKDSLTNVIRHAFGGVVEQEDWIKMLNIGNIMMLSALNYDDLELDSDPKYELLRDAILEKIVMLTVSYFCIATELRLFSKDKNDNKKNGQIFHYRAIEISSVFLPVSCPIIKHYINTYYKYYGQNLDIVPEGKIINLNIELTRIELEIDKDPLSFLKLKPIHFIVDENIEHEENEKEQINIPKLQITQNESNRNSLLRNNLINNIEKKNNNLSCINRKSENHKLRKSSNTASMEENIHHNSKVIEDSKPTKLCLKISKIQLNSLKISKTPHGKLNIKTYGNYQKMTKNSTTKKFHDTIKGYNSKQNRKISPNGGSNTDRRNNEEQNKDNVIQVQNLSVGRKPISVTKNVKKNFISKVKITELNSKNQSKSKGKGGNSKEKGNIISRNKLSNCKTIASLSKNDNKNRIYSLSKNKENNHSKESNGNYRKKEESSLSKIKITKVNVDTLLKKKHYQKKNSDNIKIATQLHLTSLNNSKKSSSKDKNKTDRSIKSNNNINKINNINNKSNNLSKEKLIKKINLNNKHPLSKTSVKSTIEIRGNHPNKINITKMKISPGNCFKNKY